MQIENVSDAVAGLHISHSVFPENRFAVNMLYACTLHHME